MPPVHGTGACLRVPEKTTHANGQWTRRPAQHRQAHVATVALAADSQAATYHVSCEQGCIDFSLHILQHRNDTMWFR